MQWALASMSSGMPLSGAAIISDLTAVASPSRLTASFSVANMGSTASAAKIKIRIILRFRRLRSHPETMPGRRPTPLAVHAKHQKGKTKQIRRFGGESGVFLILNNDRQRSSGGARSGS
jgi:hypothetical protein